jgi:hypothetical protein
MNGSVAFDVSMSYFVEEEKLHCCQHGLKFESSAFLHPSLTHVLQPYDIFAGNSRCTELSRESAADSTLQRMKEQLSLPWM